jgi:hypothetical protein
MGFCHAQSRLQLSRTELVFFYHLLVRLKPNWVLGIGEAKTQLGFRYASISTVFVFLFFLSPTITVGF